MTVATDRLEIARLVHRFGFGPKPGQYLELLGGGVTKARGSVLRRHAIDPGLAAVVDPGITDLGPPPSSGDNTAYYQSVYDQQIQLAFWWMDRMALADYPLVERMTWFWHGHWATSISKVAYALPMKIQNETLRAHAVGNFADMSRALVLDGALIYWLDGEVNVANAPNENLARELMELFTLGVGNYTEDDVKAAARGLTGYQVATTNGTVTFDPNQHDYSTVHLLGTTRAFTAPALSDYLVAREVNATFIARRLWFRFISSTVRPPRTLVKNFAHRNIGSLVHAIARDPAMRRAANSQAKSPVEWFVSSCRALRITPSLLPSTGTVSYYLNQMGQFPFNPPSVGGWPYDEAWLTAASTQYRFSLAEYLVQHGNVEPLGASRSKMVQATADWLGVAEWSPRTKRALEQAVSDPSRLALLALCAPEYAVSV
jgi:uncharacterized protein (DUF1800 family)